RLERHLARLSASCAYFGRPFPEALIRERLAEACQDAQHAVSDGEAMLRRRVRLTLDEHGTVEVDVALLDGDACGSDTLTGGTTRGQGDGRRRSVAILPHAVNSADVF